MSSSWSSKDINTLLSMYGRATYDAIAIELGSKTEASVKAKILSLQKSFVLPEVNAWTLNECLFMCDTFRVHTVDEFAYMLNHPKWSIQGKVDILTQSMQQRSGIPLSPMDQSFIIEKSPDLILKEIAVYLNRSEKDIKEFIDYCISLRVLSPESLQDKDIVYTQSPTLKKVVCTKCNNEIRIRHNNRLPETIYCSIKCKLNLELNGSNFIYLYLDEKRTLGDIAKIFSIDKNKAIALSEVYFPLKTRTLEDYDEKDQIVNNGISNTGKRQDLDGLFVRSGWEANVARILNKKRKKWEYEPKTFIFSNISRGSISYTPDFLVHNMEGRNSKIWIEVKGRMNTGDYTKLLNFKKCYPKEFEKLRGVVAKNSKAHKSFKRLGIPILWYYGDLKKEFKDKIANWEGI